MLSLLIIMAYACMVLETFTIQSIIFNFDQITEQKKIN